MSHAAFCASVRTTKLGGFQSPSRRPVRVPSRASRPRELRVPKDRVAHHDHGRLDLVVTVGRPMDCAPSKVNERTLPLSVTATPIKGSRAITQVIASHASLARGHRRLASSTARLTRESSMMPYTYDNPSSFALAVAHSSSLPCGSRIREAKIA